MSGTWRIEQLREWVAKALELSPTGGQASGRVQDVPDVRMIRYYTTLGLIDRAAEIRGRTAFYGPKHLQQLVAIKRLQAQGLSLVQVQELLAAASPQKLAELSALPGGFVESAVAAKDPPTAEMAARQALADATAVRSPETRRRFWADVPEPDTSGAIPTAAPPVQASMVPLTAAVIVPLDAGVSLVLEGVRPEQISREVLAALEPAAAALREVLAKAGLRQRIGNGDVGGVEQPSDQRGGTHEPQSKDV